MDTNAEFAQIFQLMEEPSLKDVTKLVKEDLMLLMRLLSQRQGQVFLSLKSVQGVCKVPVDQYS